MCKENKGSLLPSEKCLLCDRSLEEVGGRRIIAQELRGVALSGKREGGGNPDFPKRSIKLHEDKEDPYVMIWGQAPEWDDDLLRKAREVYLNGARPWFSQICGMRGCRECGEPINLPVGSDVLYDSGCSSHVALLPVDAGCINPECKKYSNPEKWSK